MDPAELDRVLRLPAAYADVVPGATEVTRIETHLSRLYFVGARVYKVKREVDFGFVDFSTLAKRRQACDDEVRLNRRLAPATYLGVVPIVRGADGTIRVGGAGESGEAGEPGEKGETLEYAVEMERLPAAGMLDARLARGEIDRDVVVRLVETLAAFHERAGRGADVDAFATPEAIERRLLQNLDEAAAACRRLDESMGATTPSAPPRLLAALRGAFTRFVRERRDLLLRRVAERRVCEGHGDLHAGNLCVIARPSGAPPDVVAFDCIEFSRALRCLDVAADLAFLRMDLDRLGFPAFGTELARRYAERTRDPELATLLPLYESHLAVVRAKVAALRGAGGAGGASDESSALRQESRAVALRYFALAVRPLLPPLVVATCSLPDSGKSAVARAVAPPLHLLHLQADFERKLLCGLAPDAATPPERLAEVYAPETTARTYARLLELARVAIARGRGALLDATFSRADQRAAAAALARDLSAPARPVPFVLLHCRIDDEQARRRLAARTTGPGQFSDADVAVYERARPIFQVPDEVAPAARVDLDPATAPEEAATAVVERALRQLETAGLPPTFRSHAV